MEKFIEFFSFSDPSLRYVALGTALLSASAAVVGSFAFLKKRALIGDAVAHAVLPGICFAFWLLGDKHPVAVVVGALVSGWLSLLVIDWLTAHTKIKQDAAIGMTLSVFFGCGILMLTTLQHSGNPNVSGLEQFLFGTAAGLASRDVWLFAGISVTLLAATIAFYYSFKIVSFDEHFAQVIGLPVKRLNFLLTSLTVLSVVAGIQAVGVVLMSALLITPVAAARFWTERLPTLLWLSAGIGVFSGLMGVFASFAMPGVPTGPSVVLIASFLAGLSFSLAPKRGMLAKFIRQRMVSFQITEENLLKLLYKMGEENGRFYDGRSAEDILQRRAIGDRKLNGGLYRLRRQGFVKKSKGGWHLTKEGKNKGRRVTKLHRLWELYLTEYLNIAHDHVHDDAETIEHILTPELEQRLETLLEYPDYDPHQTVIPYK